MSILLVDLDYAGHGLELASLCGFTALDVLVPLVRNEMDRGGDGDVADVAVGALGRIGARRS